MTITYNFRIHLQDFSQKQQIVVVCQNKLWHASSKRKSLTVKETDEEKRVLCALTQKQQEALKLIEAKERESRKQMESTINLIHKLLAMITDFEARVNKDISRNCLRYAIIVLRSFFYLFNITLIYDKPPYL